MTGPEGGILRSVAVAVPDPAAAERLLTGVTDLPVTVRDGDRWIALDAGGLGVALTVPGELPGDAAVSLNVKVSDVAAVHALLVAAGGASAQPPTVTAHEERAAVRLGGDVVLSLYRPLPRP